MQSMMEKTLEEMQRQRKQMDEIMSGMQKKEEEQLQLITKQKEEIL